MEDGLVNRALAVSADGGHKYLKGAELLVLQAMDLLRQYWPDWAQKMQAEKLDAWRIVFFCYFNQFQRQRLPTHVHVEFGVQLLAKNLAVQIIQGFHHAEATGYARLIFMSR